MKTWLRTRKIMAKIDREEDIYVIADRLNQAIRDLDGNQEEFENRLHALEREKGKFQTETGVHRIVKNMVGHEATKLSKRAVMGLLGLAVTATVALAGWVLKHVEWK